MKESNSNKDIVIPKVSVDEVLSHPKMDGYIQNFIDSYNLTHSKDPGKNRRYKRNPIDYLIENYLFNVSSLKGEFTKILNKESNLSSTVRNTIKEIILIAAGNLLEKEYSNKK